MRKPARSVDLLGELWPVKGRFELRASGTVVARFTNPFTERPSVWASSEEPRFAAWLSKLAGGERLSYAEAHFFVDRQGVPELALALVTRFESVPGEA